MKHEEENRSNHKNILNYSNVINNCTVIKTNLLTFTFNDMDCISLLKVPQTQGPILITHHNSFSFVCGAENGHI